VGLNESCLALRADGSLLMVLRSWRERQRILYAVDTEGTKGLVAFLVNDCCGGQPELCGYGEPKARKAKSAER